MIIHSAKSFIFFPFYRIVALKRNTFNVMLIYRKGTRLELKCKGVSCQLKIN